MTTSSTAVEVKEKPLVLRSSEVRAVLERRKTQERVAIKPQPTDSWMREEVTDWSQYYKTSRWGKLEKHLWICHPTENKEIVCPYGTPGDRLWVREALRWTDYLVYDADREPVDADLIPNGIRIGRDYLPMTHMPRWASRITLEIKSIRVERLQDISCQDVLAEGSPVPLREHSNPELGIQCVSAKEWFAEQWNKVNARRGLPWESNPWIWRIKFQKL